MLASMGNFLFTLWTSLFLIFWTQASASVTVIYGYDGMPTVHLPCIAFEKLGRITETSHIESMWAKQTASSYQLVITKDKNGTKETFRQLNLGENTIHPNASLKNVQFYGRVNVSPSYGLIINNVQLDDAGKFLCQYKNTNISASDDSEVELIVFNGTGAGTPKNDSTDSGNEDDPDNSKKGTSCTIWKVLSGVFIGLFVSVVVFALGGVVYNKCPAYFERDCSAPQVGDAGSRNTVTYRNGEDFVEVGGGILRIGNTRDSEGSCAVNGYKVGNVDINGKTSGNKYEEGILGDYRADSGNVAMEENFLTESNDLTSALE
ncbi:hypothetical protein ACROYT_G027920 [Oculina patagonica]